MGKCTICLNNTNEKVDDNIGGKSFLCLHCQKLFSQCKVCSEYNLIEDMEEGFCNNCK